MSALYELHTSSVAAPFRTAGQEGSRVRHAGDSSGHSSQQVGGSQGQQGVDWAGQGSSQAGQGSEDAGQSKEEVGQGSSSDGSHPSHHTDWCSSRVGRYSRRAGQSPPPLHLRESIQGLLHAQSKGSQVLLMLKCSDIQHAEDGTVNHSKTNEKKEDALVLLQ